MTFRRIPFAVSAALVALAAIPAAQADTRGGVPLGLGGLTSNSVVANNVAAGTGNVANQSVFAQQSGPSVMPYTPKHSALSGGFGSNSLNANNIAAGFGNKANQMVGVLQGPGGFNRVDANNIAAGFGNTANQQIMATQR